jgi:hypothetical protein
LSEHRSLPNQRPLGATYTFPCPLSEHGIVRGPASDQNDCKSALYVISLKKNKTPTGPDQTIGVGSWNKSISKQPNGNVGRYDLPPRKDLSLATCLPKEFTRQRLVDQWF